MAGPRGNSAYASRSIDFDSVQEPGLMVIPLGDTHRTYMVPVVTYVLIALNVAVYLVQLTQPQSFTSALAATPYEIFYGFDLQGPVELLGPGRGGGPATVLAVIDHATSPIPVWWTLLTALFLHETPLHLAGNMLYLWIFGDNVEEMLGHVSYLLAYLACGLVGTLCQIAGNPDSILPTLGASGAIAGVMGMYLVWFPRHKIRVLLIRVVVEVPAVLVLGVWVLIQVASSLVTMGRIGQAGGIAFLAHLGGAAVGFAVAMPLRQRARALDGSKPTVAGNTIEPE